MELKKNDRFIDNNYVYLYKKRKRLVSGLFLFSPRGMRYREITRGKKNLLNHYRFLKITQFKVRLYLSKCTIRSQDTYEVYLPVKKKYIDFFSSYNPLTFTCVYLVNLQLILLCIMKTNKHNFYRVLQRQNARFSRIDK